MIFRCLIFLSAALCRDFVKAKLSHASCELNVPNQSPRNFLQSTKNNNYNNNKKFNKLQQKNARNARRKLIYRWRKKRGSSHFVSAHKWCFVGPFVSYLNAHTSSLWSRIRTVKSKWNQKKHRRTRNALFCQASIALMPGRLQWNASLWTTDDSANSRELCTQFFLSLPQRIQCVANKSMATVDMIVSNYSFTCFLLVQSQWFAKPLGCFSKICRSNWKMCIVTIFSSNRLKAICWCFFSWVPSHKTINISIQTNIESMNFQMVKRYWHKITSIQLFFHMGLDKTGDYLFKKR